VPALTTTTTTTIFDQLTLACGLVIPNRLAKAALEENLSAEGQVPGEALFNLYRAWSSGGAGLLLTGNVMIDRRALTGPGGVVLDASTGIAPFKEWATAAKSGGAKAFMQISHPGRQVFSGQGMTSLSPSDVALDMGKYSGMFERPRALSHDEIVETIGRYVATAQQAERAGFDGVEIHAAHGYLVSQFLSPLTNRRTDGWGGSLENRSRFLLEIVRGVRAAVSPGFAVAVKLNSADFQRGGYDENDAREVIGMLNGLDVDLVELSGGSYESPAMQGQTADARTLAREAYFLEFAVDLLDVARMPLMVTGGISRRATAESVIASGVAIAGMGTALAMTPNLPTKWREAEHVSARPRQLGINDKALRALGNQAFISRQMTRLGAGRDVHPTASPLVSLVAHQLRKNKLVRRYKKWLAT
jgi:2,4-dienoyl-CoA reductase-like NADH-dependent reductase (Old Yellow Enzyme family)